MLKNLYLNLYCTRFLPDKSIDKRNKTICKGNMIEVISVKLSWILYQKAKPNLHYGKYLISII